jgi:serine/threonine protein phosphatase PrpC
MTAIRQVVRQTDTGRRRRNNEDAYVCEPPLFAIADGMGGAQGGEIASQLAAEALRRRPTEAATLEQHVDSLIQLANRQVYDRASGDVALSGMGTTLTLALVGDGEIVFGHVGDSRAYRLREGTLEQITDDHSLVAELTRAGKLSEEEAETHPQRSVITRALGTDPDVDGDVFTVATQVGDVFLLCSDGLTDMLDDALIAQILQKHRSKLKDAARALVREANRHGGEDNITVILFEIGEAVDQTVESVVQAPSPAEDEEDTLSEVDAVPVVSSDGDVPRAERRAVAAHRRRRRRLYGVAAGLLVLILAGLGLFGLSQSHFVGAASDGHVAVYQGIPYDLPAIHLYRTVYESPLYAAQLTQPERRRLFDHNLTSYATARSAVRNFEQEIEP